MSTGTDTNAQQPSPPIAPAPFEIAGIIFTPVDGKPRTYTYRATRLTVAELDDGLGRQLSLIEAGPIGLLSITTQLAPTSAELESARAILADRAGGAPAPLTLVSQAVSVGPVSLLTGDGGGAFTTLATTTSSGAYPFSAVFSRTLDPAQLASVRSGIAGQRGRFAARCQVTIPAARATETTTTLTSSLEVEVRAEKRGQPQGEACARYVETEGTSSASQGSENREEPAAETVLTDAADWKL